MRALLILTTTALAIAGAAQAAEMQGTVKSVDMKKHEITLDDGMMVKTEKKVKLDGVMAGDKVKITTNKMKMGTMVEKM
jgi:hypothetical protein